MTMAVRKSLLRRVIRSVRARKFTENSRAKFLLTLKMPAVGANHAVERMGRGLRYRHAIWSFGIQRISSRGNKRRAHAATSIRHIILWANETSIRRAGSTGSRIRSSGNLEKCRRSPGPPSGSILDERARSIGARRKCTEVGAKEAILGRTGPESGDADRWHAE